jgi:hypothetical protein
MTTLRYRINGLGFRRTYAEGDDSWKAVTVVLTEAGIDVHVKLPGQPRNRTAFVELVPPVGLSTDDPEDSL